MGFTTKELKEAAADISDLTGTKIRTTAVAREVIIGAVTEHGMAHIDTTAIGEVTQKVLEAIRDGDTDKPEDTAKAAKPKKSDDVYSIDDYVAVAKSINKLTVVDADGNEVPAFPDPIVTEGVSLEDLKATIHGIAADELQVDDDISAHAIGVLNSMKVGPWYDPAKDTAKAAKAARNAKKAPKAKKERVKKEKKAKVKEAKPKKYTRSDSLRDALYEMCDGGNGVKTTDLMRRSNEIYVEKGGADNPTATNVVNYGISALLAFGVVTEIDRLIYLNEVTISGGEEAPAEVPSEDAAA